MGTTVALVYQENAIVNLLQLLEEPVILALLPKHTPVELLLHGSRTQHQVNSALEAFGASGRHQYVNGTLGGTTPSPAQVQQLFKQLPELRDAPLWTHEEVRTPLFAVFTPACIDAAVDAPVGQLLQRMMRASGDTAAHTPSLAVPNMTDMNAGWSFELMGLKYLVQMSAEQAKTALPD